MVKKLRRYIRLLLLGIEILRTPLTRRQVLIVQGRASLSKLDEVRSRIEFICSHLDQAPPIKTVQKASILNILRFSIIVYADSCSLARLPSRKLPWVISLDYERNPRDGWALHDVGRAFTQRDHQSTVDLGRRIFDSHVASLKTSASQPVYLFGTGPSLQNAFTRSFEDGIRVVCNTIVKDQRLWQHLQPNILCAGDAIYHFGENIHAKTFRLDALKRLKESNGSTIFIYPAFVDLLVRSEFSEVESLLVPIPFGDHLTFDADLSEQFCLPALGNVLNNLLIPIGMTLSKDVRLWGFDGRGPSDQGFWKNSESHSYPELIQFIKAAHPAFFSEMIPPGKEAEYVKINHGDSLDDRLIAAESVGYTFTMLHTSWTETLQKRFRP